MKGTTKSKSSFFSYALAFIIIFCTVLTPFYLLSTQTHASEGTAKAADASALEIQTEPAPVQEKKQEPVQESVASAPTSDSAKAPTQTQAAKSEATQASSKPTTPAKSTQPADEKTDAQIRSLVTKLEARYPITILYQSGSLSGYRPLGKTIAACNKETLFSMLNTLAQAMQKYPAGMFREMNDFGINLKVYLAASVSGNAFVGLTETDILTDIKLTFINQKAMAATVHHEFMHLFETYAQIVSPSAEPFEKWTSLNPQGFTYPKSGTAYTYPASGQDAYFVSSYAKTNKYEDKATVFSYMMLASPTAKSCFATAPHLRAKAAYLSEILKGTFDCIDDNSPAVWDAAL